MSPVIADRFTTRTDDSFVVFLIGMQVNKFFAFRKWLSVAQAMPRMMAVLQAHPEKGFLHGEVFFRFAPLNVIMVSYWRSFEDLERFARSKDDPHLAPWQRFMREIGTDGSVGIYHETYPIAAANRDAGDLHLALFLPSV